MKLLTRSYTFKYIKPSSQVYVISQIKPPMTHPSNLRNSIYTEQYLDTNAVVAFVDYNHCYGKSLNINAQTYVHATSVLDLQGICGILKLPMNVILHAYCDVEDKVEHMEIYFYNFQKDDEHLKFLN